MPSPITEKLIYDLTTVAGPTLSPDGDTLVFAKAKVDATTKQGCSELMKMDLGSGKISPLTLGNKDSFPKCSPDGTHIAFLRADDKERRQLFSIPLSGDKARSLTRLPGGISDFEWAPDSKRLVLVGKVDPDQLPDDHDPKQDPRVKVVGHLRYRFDTLGWLGDAHNHLFTVGLDDDEPKQITEGDWDESAPAWSPDGTRIAFVSAREENHEFTFRSQAYVMDAAGGEAEPWSEGLVGVAKPTWSPDGTQLLVIASNDERAHAFWHGELFLLLPGQPPQKLTDDSICPQTGFPPILPAPEIRWTQDGRLVFLADVKGESFLFELNLQNEQLKQIAGGGGLFNGFGLDAATSRGVVMALSPSSPGDLHAIDLASGESKRLTDYNDEYLNNHPPARLEKFTQARAGMEIQSRLLLPPGFDESGKYPLVVDIHGGPHGAFYDSFIPWQQVVATAGYIVLCVNPRGSSTYGLEFGKAVLGDWGGEDYLDIMQAVDEVSARPYVDENRMGLHGYSYGGFMSSWIVGQTTRFKAAVVGAPCIDLPSFAGTSDIGVSFGEVQWGGQRFDAYEDYLKHSPLTYAPDVETPVLLLHGEADHRCPIEQSEQYFVALKRLGKEVGFVRFPGCSHLFLRLGHPRMREEYLRRMKAWLDKYLMADTAAHSEQEVVSVEH